MSFLPKGDMSCASWSGSVPAVCCMMSPRERWEHLPIQWRHLFIRCVSAYRYCVLSLTAPLAGRRSVDVVMQYWLSNRDLLPNGCRFTTISSVSCFYRNSASFISCSFNPCCRWCLLVAPLTCYKCLIVGRIFPARTFTWAYPTPDI